jgi:hypothetical protein
MRFVRITYQECVEDGSMRGYHGVGLDQDIRLKMGRLVIGDNASWIDLDISDGKLFVHIPTGAEAK